MEKKCYQKPITELNYINNSSFIAASELVFEEETPEVNELMGLLDDCLQIQGQITNEQVKTYLLSRPGHTACFKGWLKDESGKKSCDDTRFQNNVGVTLTYDETNTRFILNFSGCRNQVTNIGRY